MKLVHRSVNSDGAGSIKLIAEEGEDLWHAYNLIRDGDRVTATTFRRVSKEGAGGSGGDKVKMTLTVRVEDIDFDPEGNSIRLKGKNLTEIEHVKLMAYHTLELELNRAFTIDKDVWDAVDLERVRESTDVTACCDLAAVLITEGLAHVCLVGSSCTSVRAKIETKLPRKRGPAIAGYEDAWNKFMTNCYNAVVRHVDFSIVKCLVIAGPGFAKESLKKWIEEEAVRQDNRPLLENKQRIVVAHASSAYKHALNEVLSSPNVASLIKDTKAAAEVQALQDFYGMLSEDPNRAFYGPGHVFAAHELGAIQKLLITDTLFRVNNVKKRQRYLKLMDEVRDGGGEVLLFSAMHISGQQLDQLTGIAALLRFPLEELANQELQVDF